jgi:hypothetical protein
MPKRARQLYFADREDNLRAPVRIIGGHCRA